MKKKKDFEYKARDLFILGLVFFLLGVGVRCSEEMPRAPDSFIQQLIEDRANGNR